MNESSTRYVYVQPPEGYCLCGCGEKTRKRNGRPNKYIHGHNAATADPVASFWSCVDISDDLDGCWEWTSTRTAAGYGVLGVRGRRIYAHRMSFELHHRALDDGEQACHSCDNPPCVNPGHLFAGTQLDNMRDMIRKGRRRPDSVSPRGEDHPAAKLTEGKVLAIRAAARSGVTRRELAERYGVSQGCIDGVVSRRKWGHVA